MAADGIHVQDIGVAITCELVQEDGVTPLDLSSATSIQIVMMSPSGVRKLFTANIVGDDTAGIVVYESHADDLDEPSTWRVQPVITYSDGDTIHCEVVKMKVKANI